MEIKFHGHSCFELSEGDDDRPHRPVPEAEQPGRGGHRRGGRADPIAVSHGHADHIADAVPVAKRTGAALRRDRRARQLARRAGGRERQRPEPRRHRQFDWGWIKLVPAWHTSTLAGSDEAPFSAEHGIAIGTPAGLLINIGGKTVYHAGDTCLFGDMKLIAERNPVDVALLPIGGHYTMDRHDAVVAAEFVGADDRDPDALRHLPADRDRRRGLQGRRRVEDLGAGRGAEAGRDAHRLSAPDAELAGWPVRC